MFSTLILQENKKYITSTLYNLLGIAFIYLIPTFSHLTALPVYFIEPMRLIVLLSLLFTSKGNAYVLAVTLPIISLLLSGHPSLMKMFLIMGELSLNIYVFQLLSSRMNKFSSMLSGILISKIVYYAAKFALIEFALLNSALISTPLWIQAATTLIFSFVIWLGFKRIHG